VFSTVGDALDLRL
jgi:hypothetical protein